MILWVLAILDLYVDVGWRSKIYSLISILNYIVREHHSKLTSNGLMITVIQWQASAQLPF